MPFIRLTMALPRPERREEVRRHYEELITYLAGMPGFIDGWVLEGSDNPGEIGRMTMWESEADANHAANDQHSLALHSELHFDVQGNLWDRSFTSISHAGPNRR